MNKIIILGAGGHAKVVADILTSNGKTVIGYVDDDPDQWGTLQIGFPVLGPIATCLDYDADGFVMGVEENGRRREVVECYEHLIQGRWINAIHPSAILSRATRVGHGVVIVAGAIINADTSIGNHVIINTAATVGHDCVVGNYVHVGSRANLAGGVEVGDEALIGIAAAVIPLKKIGCRAIVGARSVVVRDVPEGVTAIGVPARWDKKSTSEVMESDVSTKIGDIEP